MQRLTDTSLQTLRGSFSMEITLEQEEEIHLDNLLYDSLDEFLFPDYSDIDLYYSYVSCENCGIPSRI